MSAYLDFDIREMQRKATQILGAFAVDTLRNKKWITKSYTSTFPFTDDNAARQSQAKIFKIILREILKAMPVLKDERDPRYSIKKPEVSSSNLKIFVTGIKTAALVRYSAYLTRKLREAGINLVVNVHQEVFYKSWDPIVGQSYSLELAYSYFRPIQNPGNPYKLFLLLDEIFQVFSTTSKYMTVVDNDTKTLFPLYINQKQLRLEFEANMKKAEEQRIKEEFLKKSPKKKSSPIFNLNINPAPTDTTGTNTYYYATTDTTTTTTATDIAWPNTARR